MDGNGRWAAARGLPRVAGHRAGAAAVRRALEAAGERGITWVTLYAFSSENWRRPETEISDLTGLLRHYVRSELAEFAARGVRLRVIGERDRFPARHPRRPRPCRADDGGQHRAQPHGRPLLRRARRDRGGRPRLRGGCRRRPAGPGRSR